MELFGFSLQDVGVFVLMLTRIGAVCMTAPVLSHQSVPVQIKAAMTICIGFLLFGSVHGGQIGVPQSLFGFTAVLIKELGTGVLIGFFAQLAFLGIQACGDFIGPQMGLNLDSLFDPISGMGDQGSLPGQLYLITASLLFLLLDGHHWLLRVFSASFDAVPIGQAQFGAACGKWLLSASSQVFLTSIRLGAPIFTLMILLTVIMGILARLIPDIEILFLMIPFKISVALLALALSLPFFAGVSKQIFLRLETDMAGFVHSLSG